MSTQRVRYLAIDAAGQTIAPGWYAPSGVGPDTVLALIAQYSLANMPIMRVTTTQGGVVQGPFTDGSVTQAARLQFRTSAGGLAKILIPAPDPGIFLMDGQTVDPTTIVDLLTALTSGQACVSNGNLLTSYQSGIRITAPALPTGLR